MRIDSRRALALALVVAGVTAVAGCGEKQEPSTDGPVVPLTTTTSSGGQESGQGTTTTGGDGDGSSKPVTDEKAVQSVIERFLISPNADEVCSRLITPEFLRRTYGGLAGCRAARKPASLAASAQISGLQVTGASARANAKPNGGVNNDEKLQFELRRTGEQWRIANIRSNVRVGP